ncbi:MAG TPA: hypothetical protein P5013_07350 [Methanoregula sp.]|nr:hypothetical protein [Methanoregula sp.]
MKRVPGCGRSRSRAGKPERSGGGRAAAGEGLKAALADRSFRTSAARHVRAMP